MGRRSAPECRVVAEARNPALAQEDYDADGVDAGVPIRSGDGTVPAWIPDPAGRG